MYCGLVTPPAVPLMPVTKQGFCYDAKGQPGEIDLLGYLAFWDETWERRMSEAAGRLRGIFVTGGVLTAADPVTMPAIPGVFNRQIGSSGI